MPKGIPLQMHKMVCESCGASARKRSGARFCSKACGNRSDYKKHREQYALAARKWNKAHPGHFDKYYTKVDHPEKPCMFCKQEFKPKRINSYFCSRMCYRNSWFEQNPQNKENADRRTKNWLMRTENGKSLRRKMLTIRRAKEYGVKGSHTREEFIALCEKYQYFCVACATQFPLVELTEDHIVPLSKGGGDSIQNLQPLCKPCNSRKHTKSTNYLTDWDEKFNRITKVETNKGE